MTPVEDPMSIHNVALLSIILRVPQMRPDTEFVRYPLPVSGALLLRDLLVGSFKRRACKPR